MAFTDDPQSVSDLLPPPALDDVRAFLMAYLSVPQNQVSNWGSGAVLRTMWETEALIIQDLVGNSMIGLVENGYPGTASDESLTKLAHGWFGIDRAVAQVATQTVTISCDAQHGPYSAAQIAPLVGVSTDGAVYSLTAGAAILGSGASISVTMTAQTPAAARGLVVGLLNPLPGVRVTAASIATFGADADSDAVVAAAMDARFPSLDDIPALDRVIAWALAAAPAPLITRYRMDADPVVPGGVLVTLANAGGAVAGGTVTAVQAAFDLLSAITDFNTAQNSTPHPINASGVVTIKTAFASAAMTAADAAWVAYLSGAQIGAAVFLEALNKAVGDAIKIDPGSNFTGQALAGAGGDGNVALAPTEVPIAGGTLASQLTWNLT